MRVAKLRAAPSHAKITDMGIIFGDFNQLYLVFIFFSGKIVDLVDYTTSHIFVHVFYMLILGLVRLSKG